MFSRLIPWGAMQKFALVILALFATGLVACNRPTGAAPAPTGLLAPGVVGELPTVAGDTAKIGRAHV